MPPPATPWTVVHREANQNLWQRTTFETSASGDIVTNRQQYIELATGLNHLNGGNYVPSDEKIVILPDGGAAATNGQHQAYFPADIYNGFIELVTPDGRRLKERPLGISYFDGTNSVPIAELTNSVGQILASGNQIIWTNCFAGADCDLLATYRNGGFECDLVFRKNPPEPERFGMEPKSARIELLTEFFNPPNPVKIEGALNRRDGLRDTMLQFGKMSMVRGKAFSFGLGDQTRSPSNSVPVYKTWTQLPDTQNPSVLRTFLIEEVPYPRVSAQLKALTASLRSPASLDTRGLLCRISKSRLLPSSGHFEKSTATIELARSDLAGRPGVIWDYYIINSDQNNYTFQGDLTYYISADVNMSGTTIFEGGAVLKYATGASLNFYDPAVISDTATEYLPTIFTAKDDNTVGDTISGSTGSPSGYYYADPAISFHGSSSTASALALHDFQIAYANQAVYADGISLTASFVDGKIVNCYSGLYVPGQAGVSLLDLLFADFRTALTLGIANANAVNVTFANSSGQFFSQLLATDSNGNQSAVLNLVNCILANVTSYSGPIAHLVSGDHNGFYNSGAASTYWYNGTTFGSDSVQPNFSPFFVTAGGGHYYLASGCGFENGGSSDIDPTLLGILQHRTTQPPDATSYVNTTISYYTALYPRGLGDTGQPDLGYHYPILDYLMGNNDLAASLYLQDGVAIGLTGSITPQDGGNVFSGFTSEDPPPVELNRVVNFRNVQEDGTSPTAFLMLNTGTDSSRQFQFHFTDICLGLGNRFSVSLIGPVFFNAPFQNISFENCRLSEFYLRGNLIPGGSESVSLKNNLFDGGVVQFLYYYSNNSGNYPVTQNYYNNLFKNCPVLFTYQAGSGGSSVWNVKDNLFYGSNQGLSTDSYGNTLLSRSKQRIHQRHREQPRGCQQPCQFDSRFPNRSARHLLLSRFRQWRPSRSAGFRQPQRSDRRIGRFYNTGRPNH